MGNGALSNSFRMKNEADRMNRPAQLKRSGLTAYGTALNIIVGLDSIFFGGVNLEQKKRLLIFLGLLQMILSLEFCSAIFNQEIGRGRPNICHNIQHLDADSAPPSVNEDPCRSPVKKPRQLEHCGAAGACVGLFCAYLTLGYLDSSMHVQPNSTI